MSGLSGGRSKQGPIRLLHAGILSGICEDLEEQRTVRRVADQADERRLQLRCVADGHIADAVLAADAFGRRRMTGGDEPVAGRTETESLQLTEDAPSPIVEQEDAQVAPQLLLPERILVVEEAEVAHDAEDAPADHEREAGGGGERALDAVDATVAEDVVAGVDVSQPHGRGIGIVDGPFAAVATQQGLEGLDGRHLGIVGHEGVAQGCGSLQGAAPSPEIVRLSRGHIMTAAIVGQTAEGFEDVARGTADDAADALERVVQTAVLRDLPRAARDATAAQEAAQAIALPM